MPDRQPAPTLDVGPVFRGELEVRQPETPEEISARIRREATEHWHKNLRETTLFYVLILGITIVASLCAWFGLFDAAAPPDTRKWAQALLQGIVVGGLAFVLGRGSK